MSKKNTPLSENEVEYTVDEVVTETPAEAAEDICDATEAPASDDAESTEAEAAPDNLQADYSALNDQYLRMAAEYDNFRKRSAREREQVHADAVCHAVKTLLPIFDNLERALAQHTEDAEYKKGVALTHKQLTDALASLGVTVIAAEPGTTFDPNLHNAVMHIEDDDFEENVIAEVFQHGFLLGEKVIRHSMVKVAN